MPFVKLDCGILDSTLWVDRDAREIFVTALLMARPVETDDELDQIEVRSLDYTGWVVPRGRYGLVEAAGVGIVRRAGIDDIADGLDALERLSAPEADSRTPDYDGRRLARVDGGYLVLNFAKYRDKDHTAAARSKRYRDRKAASRRDGNVVTRDDTAGVTRVTEAEAEAEAETDLEGEGGTAPPYPRAEIPDRLPGEDQAVSTTRNLRRVLEQGFGTSGFDPHNFTYQAAERLIANEAATIDELEQALVAWNANDRQRPAGVQKLRMFQAKNWPAVRAALLADGPTPNPGAAMFGDYIEKTRVT